MTERTALDIAPTNVEQARAWDGEEGAFWAAHAEQFDRAVGAFHERFMVAAGIRRNDHLLDIGCGTGQATRDAARTATDGSALGVDLSARMIDLARRLATAQRLTNVIFEQVDAQVHDFSAARFDVAISRTGTMFFGDPTAAFTNIARSLRSGGRLVLLVWQDPESNEWIRELTGALAAGRTLPAPRIGVPGPFAQADPGQVRAVLSSAGFVDVGFEGLSAPMRFGPSAGVAFDFVIGLMGRMLQGLDVAGRDRALADLRDTIGRHETDSGEVLFESATWLVTASRS
jgi:ubiquinone/menaquinone biosynthesis C-methylase UbiE